MVKNFIRSGNIEGRMEQDFFGRLLAPLRAVNHRVVVPDEPSRPPIRAAGRPNCAWLSVWLSNLKLNPNIPHHD